MKLLLPLLALTFLATATPAAPTTNPADLYEEAFKKLDVKTDLALLDKVDTAALDDNTEKFLKDWAPVVTLIRDAAKMPPAIWTPLDRDMAGVMPSFNSARRASYLMLLQSRWDLQHDKKPQQAADDLLASIAMSRNIARRHAIIATLVGISMETQAIDKLASLLPTLPKETIAQLPAKWAALPKGPTGKALMDGEFEYGKSASAQQKMPAGIFEAAEPFYKAVGDAMAKPTVEFDAIVDAEAMKLMLNPFVKSTAPMIKRVHEQLVAMDAKRGMFETALAIVSTGPDAAKQSKDPAGEGPFEYTAGNPGFVLKSKALLKGKPVTLIVGR